MEGVSQRTYQRAGYIERANQCLQRVQELIEIEKDSLIVDEEEEIENLVISR